MPKTALKDAFKKNTIKFSFSSFLWSKSRHVPPFLSNIDSPPQFSSTKFLEKSSNYSFKKFKALPLDNNKEK